MLSDASTGEHRLQSIELFAGAGGLALGTKRAGFEHLVVSELDEFACETLRANGDWEVVEADSRDVDWSVWHDQIDLLAGGAPCQPFSIAGLALGDLDDRNLFPEMVRAVREIRPRAVVVENVRGLGRPAFEPYLRYILDWMAMPDVWPQRREDWQDHHRRIRRAGKSGDPAYRVHGPCVLNSADFGAPQVRQRLFVVAFRADIDDARFRWPDPTHSRDALMWDQVQGEYWKRHELPPSSPPKGARSLAADLANAERPISKAWVTVRDLLADLPAPGDLATTDLTHHEHLGDGNVYSPGHTGQILDWPGKTVKAGVHGRPGGEGVIVFDDGTHRLMTVRETARLQTFPDQWAFHGPASRQLRQLGNAVTVQVAEALAGRVAATLTSKEST